MGTLFHKAVALQKRANRAEERVQELEAENQKLREQRDAANATIQQLNRIIAGDVE